MSSMFGFVSRRTFSFKNGRRRKISKVAIIFTDGRARDRPERKISVSTLFFLF